jgi:hypothetical protein
MHQSDGQLLSNAHPRLGAIFEDFYGADTKSSYKEKQPGDRYIARALPCLFSLSSVSESEYKGRDPEKLLKRAVAQDNSLARFLLGWRKNGSDQYIVPAHNAKDRQATWRLWEEGASKLDIDCILALPPDGLNRMQAHDKILELLIIEAKSSLLVRNKLRACRHLFSLFLMLGEVDRAAHYASMYKEAVNPYLAQMKKEAEHWQFGQSIANPNVEYQETARCERLASTFLDIYKLVPEATPVISKSVTDIPDALHFRDWVSHTMMGNSFFLPPACFVDDASLMSFLTLQKNMRSEFLLAYRQLSNSDPTKALAKFQRVLQCYPENVAANYFSALIRLTGHAESLTDETIQLLRSAAQTEGDADSFLMALRFSDPAFSDEDRKEAVLKLLANSVLHRHRPLLLYFIAKYYYELKQWDQAEKILVHVIQQASAIGLRYLVADAMNLLHAMGRGNNTPDIDADTINILYAADLLFDAEGNNLIKLVKTFPLTTVRNCIIICFYHYRRWNMLEVNDPRREQIGQSFFKSIDLAFALANKIDYISSEEAFFLGLMNYYRKEYAAAGMWWKRSPQLSMSSIMLKMLHAQEMLRQEKAPSLEMTYQISHKAEKTPADFIQLGIVDAVFAKIFKEEGRLPHACALAESANRIFAAYDANISSELRRQIEQFRAENEAIIAGTTASKNGDDTKLSSDEKSSPNEKSGRRYHSKHSAVGSRTPVTMQQKARKRQPNSQSTNLPVKATNAVTPFSQPSAAQRHALKSRAPDVARAEFNMDFLKNALITGDTGTLTGQCLTSEMIQKLENQYSAVMLKAPQAGEEYISDLLYIVLCYYTRDTKLPYGLVVEGVRLIKELAAKSLRDKLLEANHPQTVALFGLTAAGDDYVLLEKRLKFCSDIDDEETLLARLRLAIYYFKQGELLMAYQYYERALLNKELLDDPQSDIVQKILNDPQLEGLKNIPEKLRQNKQTFEDCVAKVNGLVTAHPFSLDAPAEVQLREFDAAVHAGHGSSIFAYTKAMWLLGNTRLTRTERSSTTYRLGILPEHETIFTRR